MLKTLVATFHTVMGSSLSQQSAVDVITSWRTKPAHELVFDSSPELYLQAVDRLQNSPNIKRSSELMSIAMARLKKEFQAVLSRQSDYPAGPSSTMDWSTVTDSTAYILRYEDYTNYEIPKIKVIIYLRSIAERMNLNGNLLECVAIYKTVRKNFLQSQLRRLHFNELKIGDNLKRFDWTELKVKIELWIQVSKICVKIFFEKEKELCGGIFEGLGEISVKDECFVGTVQEFANCLFAFAQAVSMSNPPYDRMGTVIGLYNAFWSILPNVESLFGSERGLMIRNGCEETLGRIESEVRRMLYDLERAVVNEISNFSDDRGGVDKTTNFVMEQVEHIARYRRMLTNLIIAAPLLNFDGKIIPREDLGNTNNHSFLDLHLILILIILRRNIEDKSKVYYRDRPSLGHLFMMNNIHHIVQKIESSNELQEMIGDSLRKLIERVELEMNCYMELTCANFFACFRNEGLYVMQCFKWGLSKNALKKRLKSFNAAFDEIQNVQTLWTVSDSQLKERICLSMSQLLVPAYKDFLGKLKSNPKIEKSIKYSAQDLEDLVLQKLFA